MTNERKLYLLQNAVADKSPEVFEVPREYKERK
jgi:hypothetical protein